MAKIIVWNKRAVKNLNGIIDYLHSEWGDNVTKSFVLQMYHLLDLIAAYPEIGKLEVVERGIRGFVITKHATLFYRTDINKIVVLSIFDNRQNPQKKKL